MFISLTLTSQIESFRWIQYTPLYGNGIKEQQITSMETTMILKVVNFKILWIFSRSPVFKTMLEQSGFKEQSKGESEVKDMELSTLKSLLTFIYTSKIVSENIPNLFAAADMYDIQVLKHFQSLGSSFKFCRLRGHS